MINRYIYQDYKFQHTKVYLLLISIEFSICRWFIWRYIDIKPTTNLIQKYDIFFIIGTVIWCYYFVQTNSFITIMWYIVHNMFA